MKKRAKKNTKKRAKNAGNPWGCKRHTKWHKKNAKNAKKGGKNAGNPWGRRAQGVSAQKF